ncbi:MAG: DUF167 domain-containing protein [Candidatus Tantalella remota]|nr:DUF167 domain-containing protein [Candidatus Tantalella remota]
MKLEVKVFPKAGRNEILEKDGITKVYVKAAPDKGKANAAVIKLIAKKYKVRKADVKIVTGATSRNKLLEIAGL